MLLPEIVVIGGGGHAKVLTSVLKKAGWTVLGYTDSHDHGPLLATAHLGADDMLPRLLAEHPGLLAAMGVGKIDASSARLALQRKMEELGLRFPVVVSPHAVINEEVTLGHGTAAFDGACVNSGTKTGCCCILTTNCVVEHDCRLGDNVHVAPGATVSGGVTIGDHCMIGAGAAVIQGANICAGTLVGMGSVVLGDITIPGRYVGNPVRKIA
jgi:sugar O-acyltransferase (sialic acid O-acetyltransferase NeuD family)